jgi:hypothetical protein
MSAPDTNIERQQDNHKAPLLGIKGAMLFGGLMLLSAMFYATSNGTAPSERTTVYTDAEREAAAENSILDT